MKPRTPLYLFMMLILSSCGILPFGGGHGSIKGYRYSTTKDKLQIAIMNVIKHNPNIQRDTSLDYLGSSPLLDHSNSDTIYSAGKNYYNDIKHYVTLKITSGQNINEYTFRYYGPDEDWRSSPTSEIFICYAYNKNGNGGSEGQHSFRFKGRLKRKLTSNFETELVSEIDKELHLTHIETK